MTVVGVVKITTVVQLYLDFAQHFFFGDVFDGHLQDSNVTFSKF